MKILTSSEIRKADQFTIEHEPVLSIDLMERAATACFDWIKSRFNQSQSFKVFCGTGNNGGDGLAITRLIAGAGFKVNAYVIRHNDQCSDDFKINEERLKQLHPTLVSNVQSENDFPLIKEDDVVIDALFGTGLSRPAEGLAARCIEHLNNSRAVKISIDIPSGLFADVHTDAESKIVYATYTLSFQVPKQAFLFAENHRYVGIWELLDIGLNKKFIQDLPSQKILVDAELIKEILKPRSKFSHKGMYGHAFLIAGSYGKMGAAILAAKACLRSGAGLLTVHLPACGYRVMQVAVPEAMVETDADEKIITSVLNTVKHNAVGIGCGIGTADKTQLAIKQLLSAVKVPLVVDADAINILALDKELLKIVPHGSILTPHVKEFERLTGKAKNDFHRHELQIDFAKRHQLFIVLKGAHTCIACPDGSVYFNNTGNPGMAKGGSGDALTGIILSFLAQGYSPKHASILGVYFHGAAGDIAASKKGLASMLATDLVECLGEAFLEMEV